MRKQYCVELGIRQLKNLCRMAASIVVVADTPADAISYVEHRCPELLTHATVHRVFEVERVLVDWPSGEVAILEKD